MGWSYGPFGTLGAKYPLKTERSHVRGGDGHPYHLNKHRGYARLGLRGSIRQRRRYFKDLLEFLRELKNKIQDLRPN